MIMRKKTFKIIIIIFIFMSMNSDQLFSDRKEEMY